MSSPDHVTTVDTNDLVRQADRERKVSCFIIHSSVGTLRYYAAYDVAAHFVGLTILWLSTTSDWRRKLFCTYSESSSVNKE